MLFTMPPQYYTTPAIVTPATLPPIPYFEEEFENAPVTESADSQSTVTPKTKFYVNLILSPNFFCIYNDQIVNKFSFQLNV